MDIQKKLTLSSEDLYLKGLLEKDRGVMERIYSEFYPRIEQMVRGNSGSKDDAWDIFGEALLVIYQKLLKGAASEISFSGYLFGVCRNLWLNRLRKRKNSKIIDAGEDINNIKDNESIESAIIYNERYKLFKEKLILLSVKCQQLLRLVSERYSLKEIADIAELTPDYVKLKSFRCRKKLTELMKKDPRYDELKNDDGK